MSAIRVVPKVAYDKAKAKLHNHRTLHFFLHQTYCRLMLKYTYIPYATFDVEKHP